MCREGLEGLRGVENSRSGNCRPRVADSLYRAQRLPLLTRPLGANVRKELEKKTASKRLRAEIALRRNVRSGARSTAMTRQEC